jgi:hypothetical protein
MTQPHHGKPRASNSRETRLHAALESNLLVYAAAASATGVSLLALAEPAEARIVYTRARRVLRANHSLTLDLNHDRIGDFTISNHSFCTTDVCGRTLLALPLGKNNQVAGRKGLVDTFYAYALNRSSTVGPKLAFSGKLMAASGTEYGTVGRWLNVSNRYLGLKFHVKGHVHYGWARFSVISGAGKITATLTGYAYETIPNKPIIAGKTKRRDVITVEPAMLGHLAQGATGLSAWRKKSASS